MARRKKLSRKTSFGALRDLKDFQLSYKQRRKFSRPALTVFLNITEKWGLTKQEQAGFLGLKSLNKFKKLRENSRTLNSLELEIISIVLRIYKCLHILVPASADDWMKKPNNGPLFGGDSALDFILGKEKVKMARLMNLVDTLHYLKAKCV